MTSNPSHFKWEVPTHTTQIEHGNPVRFKVRVGVGGHQQMNGLDYEETYRPVSFLYTCLSFSSCSFSGISDMLVSKLRS